MSRIEALQHYCRIGCDYCPDLGALGKINRTSPAVRQSKAGYFACSFVALPTMDSRKNVIERARANPSQKLLLSARTPRHAWEPVLAQLQGETALGLSLVVSSQSEDIYGVLGGLRAFGFNYEILILVRRSVDPWAIYRLIPNEEKQRTYFWFPDPSEANRARVDIFDLPDILAFIAELRLNQDRSCVRWRIENQIHAHAAQLFDDGQPVTSHPQVAVLQKSFWYRLLECRFQRGEKATIFNFLVDLFAAFAWLVFDAKWVQKKTAWIFAGSVYRAFGFLHCWTSRFKSHLLYKIVLRCYWSAYAAMGWIWEHGFSPMFWRGYCAFGWIKTNIAGRAFWLCVDFLWLLYRVQGWIRVHILERIFWLAYRGLGILKIQMEAWGRRTYWRVYRLCRELPLLYWRLYISIYPARKAYYFLRYQWQKRVLRTPESPYSAKSEHNCDPPAAARQGSRSL